MGNSGHNKRTEAILKEAADPSGRQSPLAMDASTFHWTLGCGLGPCADKTASGRQNWFPETLRWLGG